MVKDSGKKASKHTSGTAFDLPEVKGAMLKTLAKAIKAKTITLPESGLFPVGMKIAGPPKTKSVDLAAPGQHVGAAFEEFSGLLSELDVDVTKMINEVMDDEVKQAAKTAVTAQKGADGGTWKVPKEWGPPISMFPGVIEEVTASHMPVPAVSVLLSVGLQKQDDDGHIEDVLDGTKITVKPAETQNIVSGVFTVPDAGEYRLLLHLKMPHQVMAMPSSPGWAGSYSDVQKQLGLMGALMRALGVTEMEVPRADMELMSYQLDAVFDYAADAYRLKRTDKLE